MGLLAIAEESGDLNLPLILLVFAFGASTLSLESLGGLFDAISSPSCDPSFDDVFDFAPLLVLSSVDFVDALEATVSLSSRDFFFFFSFFFLSFVSLSGSSLPFLFDVLSLTDPVTDFACRRRVSDGHIFLLASRC